MPGIEWRGITPEELIRDIENSVKLSRENKYAFQVGLKDLDFDVDEDKLQALGLAIPFQSINHAEQALLYSAIRPTKFIEEDNTEHMVLVFDHRPVGYSGFMDCVTHSLALTNLGLFDVGRYPAVNLSSPGRDWQWFLHCKLANVEEVEDICRENNLTTDQFMEESYKALTTSQ
jgi:hypothetical protein